MADRWGISVSAPSSNPYSLANAPTQISTAFGNLSRVPTYSTIDTFFPGSTVDSSNWMGGLDSGTNYLFNDSSSLGSSLSDLGSGGSEEGSGFFDFLGSDAFGNSLRGLNLLANIGLGIMGGIQANKQYKLANEAFNFNKAATIANMNNAIDSFNQGLYDRLRTRDIMETGTENNFKQQYEKRKIDQFNGQ